MAKRNLVRVGELSKITGIPVHVLTFWARDKGLLPYSRMKSTTKVKHPYRLYDVGECKKRIALIQKTRQKPTLDELAKKLKS